MSYQLTLSKSERDAIDFVGHRYSHGNDLYDLLWGGEVTSSPDEVEWADDEKITFHIPEWVAWDMNTAIPQDDCG